MFLVQVTGPSELERDGKLVPGSHVQTQDLPTSSKIPGFLSAGGKLGKRTKSPMEELYQPGLKETSLPLSSKVDSVVWSCLAADIGNYVQKGEEICTLVNSSSLYHEARPMFRWRERGPEKPCPLSNVRPTPAWH